jgi:hypothetical protein
LHGLRYTAVAPNGETMVANLAGPVCETGDTFGMVQEIDEVGRGDLAVFHATGAYGAAMASSYNCRPLSPQVLVDGDAFTVSETDCCRRNSQVAVLPRPAGIEPCGPRGRLAKQVSRA